MRIEAASICGTDLHIQRWDQWSSERVHPPLDVGSRALRHGGRGRERRPRCRRGRLRLRGEPCHLRRVLPLPHWAGAHVRAHADPRSRSRRRLRRLRGHPSLGDLAERPGETAAAPRLPAGAVRQRRLRDVDPGSCGAGNRGARLWPGRALHDRHRAGVRRGATARVRPRPLSARSRARARRGRRRQRRRCGRCSGVVRRAERGRRHRRRLRDVRCAEGDRGRVRDRPSRRQRGPVRDPGTARDDRHRRIADLQEPHSVGRERSRDLGDLVHDALVARARRRRSRAPDNRPHAARALRRGLSRSSSRATRARSSSSRTEPAP